MEPEQKNPRRKEYKRGIDPTESRRKREDTSVELRKSKREDIFVKKRLNAAGQLAGFNAPPVPRDAMWHEQIKAIPIAKEGIMSEDPQVQLDNVSIIRKLLSIEHAPPIQEVIDAGVVPRLVQFLTFQNHPKLMFEAAWALTNIASGDQEQTMTVVRSGAVQLFVNMLRSPHPDVREQAVWALGNIAGDSTLTRDIVLKRGVMAPLLALYTETSKLSLLRNATWTLSNLCRGKPQPPWDLVKPALQVLGNLVHARDEEILTDACWALSYLSDDNGPDNEKIQAVLDAGVARRMVDLLLSERGSVQTPALRTIGNIVTGDDAQTSAVLSLGVLKNLHALMSSGRRGVRKETCWALSNITAGTPLQIQQVMEAAIFQQLISTLALGEFDIKKEAAWAISNATAGGTDDQIMTLVDMGCVGPLCDLLSITTEVRVVVVAMEGLENILRVGEKLARGNQNHVNPYATLVDQFNGLQCLENLAGSDSREVAKKAQTILSTFFELDEEHADVSLEPQNQGSQFGFGFDKPGGNDNFSFQ